MIVAEVYVAVVPESVVIAPEIPRIVEDAVAPIVVPVTVVRSAEMPRIVVAAVVPNVVPVRVVMLAEVDDSPSIVALVDFSVVMVADVSVAFVSDKLAIAKLETERFVSVPLVKLKVVPVRLPMFVVALAPMPTASTLFARRLSAALVVPVKAIPLVFELITLGMERLLHLLNGVKVTSPSNENQHLKLQMLQQQSCMETQ